MLDFIEQEALQKSQPELSHKEPIVLDNLPDIDIDVLRRQMELLEEEKNYTGLYPIKE